MAAARALLGADALIGRSIHYVAEAAALDPGLFDYAVAGPAFPTASKPGYGPALGREGLAALCAYETYPGYLLKQHNRAPTPHPESLQRMQSLLYNHLTFSVF